MSRLDERTWRDEREAAYARARGAGIALLLSVLLVGGTVVAAATAARAGGSDGPTPYAVGVDGITFPTALAAHGHVNVRLTDGRTFGLHLDPNNGHPGGAWIGATFLPWSAMGVTDGCVAWVQWSDANEHYGEGGQQPVCLAAPTTTPEPTWTPAPTPSPSPTHSTPATPTPTPTVDPTTAPSPSASPEPTSGSSPTPGSTATSTPSASPTATPAPVPTTTPSLPSPVASPSIPGAVERAEVSAAPGDSTRHEALAVTGWDWSLTFIAAVVLTLVGLTAWGVGRKGGGPAMSRSTRQADGDLLNMLSPDERALYDAPRGAQPAPGTTVTLWRLPGSWHVSSEGPEAGTWWLRPMDGDAAQVGAALIAKPDRGLPAVVRVHKGWIAVRSKDIRPAALGGAR